MPEAIPNASVSDALREVEKEVAALRLTIDECEDAIHAAYERIRLADVTPSAAPLATESAPPIEATPEPTLEPSAPEPAPAAEDPAPVIPTEAPVTDPAVLGPVPAA